MTSDGLRRGSVHSSYREDGKKMMGVPVFPIFIAHFSTTDMAIHLSLAFLLLSYTHVLRCNPVSCNNTCGIFNPIPYPFYLQCASDANLAKFRDFQLECLKDTLLFPLRGSTQRYRVISFNFNGLVIDPLPIAECNFPNLKSFNLSPYKRLSISSLNYLQLFNCTSTPSSTLKCEIPSLSEAPGNCSRLLAGGCLSSTGYHKNFSGINCASFSSWVLHNDSSRSVTAQYGLKLDWALRGQCNNGSCSTNASCRQTSLGYNCNCNRGFKGDGYSNGSACSVDLPYCDESLKINCVCGKDNANESCSTESNNLRKVLEIATGILAAAAIVAAIVIACALMKRKGCSIFKDKHTSTHHLEALLFASKGSIGTELFSYGDLEKATKYFSPERKLGNGGYGTVYTARLNDGSLAAVKRIHYLSSQGLQQVVNEVNVLSTVEHKNLVRLLGCCFDKADPLIVFEHVPNGTLAQHLQRERGEGLDWYTRITIATETAEALAYLHSIDPPIYHRDVKSANILLDYDFKTKVADFGLSRLAPDCPDGSHISTVPQGTPGYLDPEYHQSFHLSDKSDVYSFGVVLIEIITALRPVDFSRDKKEVTLAALAVAKIGNGSLDDIVDPFLQTDRNPAIRAMVQRVAELAFRCLSFDKDARPTMAEVLGELGAIKGASAPLQGLSLCLSTSSRSIGSSSITTSPRDPASLEVIDMVAAKDAGLSPTSVQVAWESKETSPSESLVHPLSVI